MKIYRLAKNIGEDTIFLLPDLNCQCKMKPDFKTGDYLKQKGSTLNKAKILDITHTKDHCMAVVDYISIDWQANYDLLNLDVYFKRISY